MSIAADQSLEGFQRVASLHDFSECLWHMRVLVDLLRKAAQRLLSTLKMFD